MRLRMLFSEPRRAFLRTLSFTGSALVITTSLLVYGARPPPPQPAPAVPRMPRGQPLEVREDTALPTCDADTAIQSVHGQLVRHGTARVIGLTDIHELGYDPSWARICQAKVNLDFGTQPVAYTIRRLGKGLRTWELILVAH